MEDEEGRTREVGDGCSARHIPLPLATPPCSCSGECHLTYSSFSVLVRAALQSPLLPTLWSRRGHMIQAKPTEPIPAFSKVGTKRRAVSPLVRKHAS